MARNIMYIFGILLVVGFGLYMELSNGEYPIVEKWIRGTPSATGGTKPHPPKPSETQEVTK